MAVTTTVNLNRLHDDARRLAVAFDSVQNAWNAASPALALSLQVCNDAAELARSYEALRQEKASIDRELGASQAAVAAKDAQLQSCGNMVKAAQRRAAELEAALTRATAEHNATVEHMSAQIATLQTTNNETMANWSVRGDRIAELEDELNRAVSAKSTYLARIMELKRQMQNGGAPAEQLRLIDRIIQL